MIFAKRKQMNALESQLWKKFSGDDKESTEIKNVQEIVKIDRENTGVLEDACSSSKIEKFWRFYWTWAIEESKFGGIESTAISLQNQSAFTRVAHTSNKIIDLCNSDEDGSLNCKLKSSSEEKCYISGTREKTQLLYSENSGESKDCMSQCILTKEKAANQNLAVNGKAYNRESSDLIGMHHHNIKGVLEEEPNKVLLGEVTTSSNIEYLEQLKKFRYQIREVSEPITPNLKYEFVCKFNGNWNKAFTRCWNLLDHCRTHTKVKPFKCTMCEKAFTQKGNLLKHIRNHSLNSY